MTLNNKDKKYLLTEIDKHLDSFVLRGQNKSKSFRQGFMCVMLHASCQLDEFLEDIDSSEVLLKPENNPYKKGSQQYKLYEKGKDEARNYLKHAERYINSVIDDGIDDGLSETFNIELDYIVDNLLLFGHENPNKVKDLYKKVMEGYNALYELYKMNIEFYIVD